VEVLMKRFIAVVFVALAACAALSFERVVERADVVSEARETIDAGNHVAAVLDRDARVAYSVTHSVLRGERVTAEQRGGRAIYRVRDGALTVRTAGGTLQIEDGVVVVDGTRYAVADGTARASALREDASLLRWLDEVNDAPGGDLVERLAELEQMRAALSAARRRSL
jgi:hypothetical protein